MRVKSGTVTRGKHKKVLAATKGMRDMRSRSVRRAKEALLKSGSNAYVGRKKKKGDFRALWNIRIGAAAKENGTSYSRLIGDLKSKKIDLDRKILASLAAEKPKIFKRIVNEAK
jgi:large subunit ribosomal protein L20